jgi:enoyl-CoA hydratase/carnithine racemase
VAVDRGTADASAGPRGWPPRVGSESVAPFGGPGPEYLGPVDHLENVRIAQQDRVRTITMHRPERLNAFDGGLVNDLADALAAAATDPEATVVVVTGSGRAFSTGADLKALAEPRPTPDAEDGVGADNGFDRLLDGLADFPKPLLMAVNGYAVGFGMTMLAFADIVFMSTDARLRCPFTELGAPTEAGSSYLFPKLLGHQQAAWTLLSSEWITAQQAHAIGLAWQLCAPEDLLDVTYDHARRLAAHRPEALAQVKRLLNAPERAELAAAFERERQALTEFVASFGAPR